MSQFSAQGVVTNVSAKEFEGRNGWVTLHSFQLEGDRAYYRTGTRDMGLQNGEYITFTYEQKGRNNNVDFNSLQRGQAPAGNAPATGASPQRAPAPARGASAGNSRDQYWADKEKRDLEKDERYQTVDVPRMSFSAAQERAVHLVASALDNDALSLGQKKGDKLDLLLDYVDQVTNKFFLESMDSHERLNRLREETTLTAGDAAPQQQQEDDFDYGE